MSWDLSIQDFPQDVTSVSEISDDFRPCSLGHRSEVIARIHQILPDVDFSDPTWGRLEQPDFCIEFNMGAKEICDGFLLHLRDGDGCSIAGGA
ncbi:MAG TPA: hypothetical protein VMF06_20480 [Candidatus Limnocylindria bacterium]|nr:hypothetical protein [Candidatus Limnocylindria bacterium]